MHSSRPHQQPPSLAAVSTFPCSGSFAQGSAAMPVHPVPERLHAPSSVPFHLQPAPQSPVRSTGPHAGPVHLTAQPPAGHAAAVLALASATNLPPSAVSMPAGWAPCSGPHAVPASGTGSAAPSAVAPGHHSDHQSPHHLISSAQPANGMAHATSAAWPWQPGPASIRGLGAGPPSLNGSSALPPLSAGNGPALVVGAHADRGKQLMPTISEPGRPDNAAGIQGEEPTSGADSDDSFGGACMAAGRWRQHTSSVPQTDVQAAGQQSVHENGVGRHDLAGNGFLQLHIPSGLAHVKTAQAQGYSWGNNLSMQTARLQDGA